MTTLTPKTFDVMTAPRIIWTAQAIAAHIGRSEDFVRKTLASEPGTPIRKKGRRLYAFADDLIAYLRD